ncbi:hypothetical protein PIROE2DRAFT_63172 [Piromyces sp. E2]|nr:hypothetical protein PIROE2DRAFT_63172 [Piromyces sp. E2]|eukprot:OUM60379.1 hypothetical protein PIROE2DRAFT_63172 [Piromyces sp. E2]
MKSIYFSLLITLCVALVKADGTAYEATWYGGPNDHYRDRNPSCTDEEFPDTKYYAAVSTTYEKELCNNYAVAMAVDNKNSEFLGKMVKVKIVDSCGECERTHIDLSETAFNDIRKKGDGVFPVVWFAATSKGEVTRDIVYPSSKTEDFAKKYFGLSKSQFISMYKKQALHMITSGSTHATFNKHDIPVATTTTTTTKKTTTTTTTQKPTTTTTQKSSSTNDEIATAAKDKATPAPTVDSNSIKEIPIDGIGDISITVGESKDNSIPEGAPIVGKTKTIDPNKTDYTEEDIKTLESQFPDEEPGNSYVAGILSGVITVSSAAGIGLLYLKKQSPSKYNELKQKFPETFDNIKRSVTKSATQLKRSVTRSANSIRGKNRKEEKRHSDHPDINYREMPEHMFGKDGLPRIELHDSPVEPKEILSPDSRIIMKLE